MKKMLVLMLAAAVLICAGCSGNKGNGNPLGTEPVSSAAADAAESDPPVIIITPSPANIMPVTVDEQVLIDDDSVRVTLKNIDTEGAFAPKLDVFIENFTEEDLIINVSNASVNGYVNPAYMSLTVPAGMKVNDSIRISQKALDDCGITVIADIEFKLNVYKTDSYVPVYISDVITVRTSEYDGFDYVFDDSGEEICNRDGIRIVIRELADTETSVPGVRFFFENNGEKDVTVSTENTYVNGYLTLDFAYTNLPAGKKAVVNAEIPVDDMGSYWSGELSEIAVSFLIRNVANYRDAVTTDLITVSFD